MTLLYRTDIVISPFQIRRESVTLMCTARYHVSACCIMSSDDHTPISSTCYTDWWRIVLLIPT